MSKLLARWLINAVAIAVAVQVVDGIIAEDLQTVALVAIIFGLVNAVVRPVLKAMTCPLVLLTLGLFVFVINALMLLLTSVIAGALALGFRVEGFGPALLGAIIITIVSLILSIFVSDRDDR